METFYIATPPPPVGFFRWGDPHRRVSYAMSTKPCWFHRKMIALFFGATWHDL